MLRISAGFVMNLQLLWPRCGIDDGAYKIYCILHTQLFIRQNSENYNWLVFFEQVKDKAIFIKMTI